MNRRRSLPGADDLLRTTSSPGQEPPGQEPPRQKPPGQEPPRQEPPGQDPPGQDALGQDPRPDPAGAPGAPPEEQSGGGLPRSHAPSGREGHDEKITVYVSAGELLGLERARLTLRGEYGMAVDRGRLVREALAVVLADFEDRAEASTLVQRLRGA